MPREATRLKSMIVPAREPQTAVTSGAYVILPRRGPGKAIGFIAAFVAVFTVAALLLWHRPKPAASAAAGGVKRVAVLPFENLGVPESAES